jgi:nucleoside-diphosphate-sugar epimerase
MRKPDDGSEARTLVLGANGFAGREFVRRARAKGWAVETPASSACDLTDPKSVSAFAERAGSVARIYIFAASRGARDSLAAARQNFLIGCGCVQLITKLRPKQILYTSSVDVYGRPPLRSPVHEKAPLFPDSYYAVSKLASESMIQLAAGEYGGKWLILRLPGLYGCGDKSKRIVAALARSSKSGKAVIVGGNGRQRRDLVWAADLARFLLSTADSVLPCEVVNFCTGESASINEIVRRMRLAGLKPRAKLGGKSHQDFDLVFDTRHLMKLFKAFEFTPMAEAFKSLGGKSQ